MRPCACQERCLHEAILVVLVTASPAFPHKNHFVERLMERHPEITTIVQNINGKKTTMVLGNRNKTLYGKGYIEDILLGMHFHNNSCCCIAIVQTIVYTNSRKGG